jgi:photosystem II stability/assembly factor-like uncharacterized protein
MQIPRRALARRLPRSGARLRAGAGSRRWGLLALTLLLCVVAGTGAAESGAAPFPDPWVGNGPFGGGGPVQADPNAPGRLYLFEPGGPYQSDNHGSSWAPTTAIAGNTPFVYAPSDPSRAYRIKYGQLTASYDGGASWTAVAAVLDRVGIETPFAISPVDADVIYTSIDVGSADRLAVSRDGGLSWTTIDAGIDRVAPDDYSDGGLLVSHVFVDPTDPQHLIVDAGTGAWESGDDGATWHRYAAVSSIAAEPGNPTHWTGIVDAQGAVISDDAGRTWSPVALGARLVEPLLPSPAQAGVLYAVVIAGTGTEPALDVRLMRSSDDGLTWQPGTAISLIPYTYPIVSLDPSNPDRLFVVGDHRQLLRSLDGGDSWQPAVTGIPDSQVTDIALDPGATGSALVTADGRLYATADGGRHWLARPTPAGYSLQIVRTAGDPSLLYDLTAAESYPFSRTLYRSRDGGETWQAIRTAAGDTHCAVAVAPAETGIVYLACEVAGLVRSTDGGTTWGHPVMLPFTLGPSQPALLMIDPRDPSVLYAGPNGQGIYRSRNAGATWRQLAPLLARPESIVLSPIDPDVIYVAGLKPPYGTTQISLIRSGDAGSSWKDVTTPGEVRAITVGRNGVVYASMQQLPAGWPRDTVMASTDGGTTWDDVSGGGYGIVAAVSGSSPGRLWTIGYPGVHSRPGLPWTGPTMSGAIGVRLARGGTILDGRVPIILRWPAGRQGASPICGYRVQRSSSGGAWVAVGRPRSAAERPVLVQPGIATRFRVQAVACSGALSTWLTGPTMAIGLIQERAAGVETSGSWRLIADPRASGGRQLLALGGGAALSLRATGVSDIGYVATTGPAGGWPQVRVNLAQATLVSLHTASVNHRRIVFSHHLADPGTAYLTIRSGGGPTSRTTVDAIITLRLLAPGA